MPTSRANFSMFLLTWLNPPATPRSLTAFVKSLKSLAKPRSSALARAAAWAKKPPPPVAGLIDGGSDDGASSGTRRVEPEGGGVDVAFVVGDAVVILLVSPTEFRGLDGGSMTCEGGGDTSMETREGVGVGEIRDSSKDGRF